jgi:hypothetical protein
MNEKTLRDLSSCELELDRILKRVDVHGWESIPQVKRAAFLRRHIKSIKNNELDS